MKKKLVHAMVLCKKAIVIVIINTFLLSNAGYAFDGISEYCGRAENMLSPHLFLNESSLLEGFRFAVEKKPEPVEPYGLRAVAPPLSQEETGPASGRLWERLKKVTAGIVVVMLTWMYGINMWWEKGSALLAAELSSPMGEDSAKEKEQERWRKKFNIDIDVISEGILDSGLSRQTDDGAINAQMRLEDGYGLTHFDISIAPVFLDYFYLGIGAGTLETTDQLDGTWYVRTQLGPKYYGSANWWIPDDWRLSQGFFKMNLFDPYGYGRSFWQRDIPDNDINSMNTDSYRLPTNLYGLSLQTRWDWGEVIVDLDGGYFQELYPENEKEESLIAHGERSGADAFDYGVMQAFSYADIDIAWKHPFGRRWGMGIDEQLHFTALPQVTNRFAASMFFSGERLSGHFSLGVNTLFQPNNIDNEFTLGEAFNDLVGKAALLYNITNRQSISVGTEGLLGGDSEPGITSVKLLHAWDLEKSGFSIETYGEYRPGGRFIPGDIGDIKAETRIGFNITWRPGGKNSKTRTAEDVLKKEIPSARKDTPEGMKADIVEGFYISNEPNPLLWRIYGETLSEATKKIRSYDDLIRFLSFVRYLPRFSVGNTDSAETVYRNGGGVCSGVAQLIVYIVEHGIGYKAKAVNFSMPVVGHALVIVINPRGNIDVINYRTIWKDVVKYTGPESVYRALTKVFPGVLTATGGVSQTVREVRNQLSERMFTPIKMKKEGIATNSVPEEFFKTQVLFIPSSI